MLVSFLKKEAKQLKKGWIVLIMVILVSTAVSALCEKPINGKTYTYDRRICSDTFYLPDGISVDRDNMVLDCI